MRTFQLARLSFLRQATSMAHATVDEANVYLCTGDPLPEDIKAIVESLLSASFTDAYNCERC